MVPQDVIIYIQAELKNGTSSVQIKNNLLSEKWPEEIINNTFIQLGLINVTNTAGTPSPVISASVANEVTADQTVISSQPPEQISDDNTKTIITVLLLIFTYPIGIIVMWFWTQWKKWLKIVLTLPIFGLILLIFLMITGGGLLFMTHPGSLKINTTQPSNNTVKAKNGESCIISSDCESNKCAHVKLGGVCTEGKVGDACFLSMDCQSKYCSNDVCTEGKVGDGCVSSFDCQTDLKCVSMKCQ